MDSRRNEERRSGEKETQRMRTISKVPCIYIYIYIYLAAAVHADTGGRTTNL